MGGNETYAAGLLQGLAAVDAPHEFVVYFTLTAPADEWRDRWRGITAKVLKSQGSVGRLLAEIPLRCVRDRLDALHVQYFVPPAAPLPTVPVIHDISFKLFPEFFSRTDLMKFRMGMSQSVGKAPRILTISENSRRDIVARYRVPAERVDVAHLAVDHNLFKPAGAGDSAARPEDQPRLRRPYVLAVGNIQPRKNLGRLLGAFSRLRAGHPELDHHLVLAGKDAYRHGDVTAKIDPLGITDVVSRRRRCLQ